MHPCPEVPEPTPTAPTIVALHSSGAGARQWLPWAGLWPAGAAVMTPDLIGYGDDAAPPGAVTLDDEAARIASLIDTLPAPVLLVGHSYGGAVALRAALARPRRVCGLFLYEPALFALLREADAPAWHDIVCTGRAIGASARAGELGRSAAQFVDYWSGGGSWAALTASRQRAIAARMPQVAAEFDALFGDPMPAAAYRRLQMPVRLLGGTRSPRPARCVLRCLARLLPQARLRLLDGRGHMGPLEDPGGVAAAFDLPTAPMPAPA